MLHDFEMTVKQANEQYEARIAEMQLIRQLPREERSSRWTLLTNRVQAIFASKKQTSPVIYAVRQAEHG